MKHSAKLRHLPIWLLAATLLACSACSAKQRLSTPEPATRPPLAMPLPISTLPFDFFEQNDQMCLTPEHYKNLALSLADTLRWVEEARWRLDYYGGVAK
jgi:hypothetical protein